MNKLNIHETAGLTRYAIRKDMVSEKLPMQTLADGSPERVAFNRE
jgi:hypothetical protein